MTFEQVTRASGTLGMLIGEGIQRGTMPSGAKERSRYVSLSRFKPIKYRGLQFPGGRFGLAWVGPCLQPLQEEHSMVIGEQL